MEHLGGVLGGVGIGIAVVGLGGGWRKARVVASVRRWIVF